MTPTPREYAIASPDIAAAMGLEAREFGVLMCERRERFCHFSVTLPAATSNNPQP